MIAESFELQYLYLNNRGYLTYSFNYYLDMDGVSDLERSDALEQYKKKLLELREWEAKLKALRLDIKGLQKDFDTTEDNIKALQSVGQIIGEVLKHLDEERCKRYRLTLSFPVRHRF